VATLSGAGSGERGRDGLSHSSIKGRASAVTGAATAATIATASSTAAASATAAAVTCLAFFTLACFILLAQPLGLLAGSFLSVLLRLPCAF